MPPQCGQGSDHQFLVKNDLLGPINNNEKGHLGERQAIIIVRAFPPRES